MNELYRVMDRGRGAFCGTDKQGNPLPMPPRDLAPTRSKDNPRASRHIDKTAQDRMPVAERPRVIAANQRREAMAA